MSRPLTIPPLDPDSNMIIAAQIAHLVCRRGIDTTEDRQWRNLLEQWLIVKEIPLTEIVQAAERARLAA